MRALDGWPLFVGHREQLVRHCVFKHHAYAATVWCRAGGTKGAPLCKLTSLSQKKLLGLFGFLLYFTSFIIIIMITHIYCNRGVLCCPQNHFFSFTRSTFSHSLTREILAKFFFHTIKMSFFCLFLALKRNAAVCMHFFFLSAFFWLNTMCFNIWWTFS